MSSIPRGVTPTFVLTFADEDLDLTAASNVYVTFRGGPTVTKTGGDLDVEAKKISVYLSQAETLAFTQGNVSIQANWTYPNGARAASEIVRYLFSEQLLERVVE